MLKSFSGTFCIVNSILFLWLIENNSFRWLLTRLVPVYKCTWLWTRYLAALSSNYYAWYGLEIVFSWGPGSVSWWFCWPYSCHCVVALPCSIHRYMSVAVFNALFSKNRWCSYHAFYKMYLILPKWEMVIVGWKVNSILWLKEF